MHLHFKKILFIALATIFLFLISFNFVLNFSEKTPAQEEVFAFLNDEPQEQKETREIEPIETKTLKSYTHQEIAHLDDVKSLMKKVDWFFYLLIPLLTILFIRLRKEKEVLLDSFLTIGKITIAFAALLRFLTLYFFEEAFVFFHLVFFPQGNWMFPVDSMLIQTFPLEFFINFTRNFLLTALLLGSLFILLPLFWRYVRKKF